MASLEKKTNHPIRMHLITKILQPFEEEGHSANENAGFPDTTKPHVTKARHNADEVLLVCLIIYRLVLNT